MDDDLRGGTCHLFHIRPACPRTRHTPVAIARRTSICSSHLSSRHLISANPGIPPSFLSLIIPKRQVPPLPSFILVPRFVSRSSVWHPSRTLCRCFFFIHQVALWSQRAAREDGCPVVWDYHVLLLLRPVVSAGPDEINDGQSVRPGSFIYDFDSTLDLPCDAQGLSLFRRLSPCAVQGKTPNLRFNRSYRPNFRSNFSSSRWKLINVSLPPFFFLSFTRRPLALL